MQGGLKIIFFYWKSCTLFVLCNFLGYLKSLNQQATFASLGSFTSVLLVCDVHNTKWTLLSSFMFLLIFSIMFPTPRVHVGGCSSVKVFVRIRPLLPAECEEDTRNIIYASSKERQVCSFKMFINLCNQSARTLLARVMATLYMVCVNSQNFDNMVLLASMVDALLDLICPPAVCFAKHVIVCDTTKSKHFVIKLAYIKVNYLKSAWLRGSTLHLWKDWKKWSAAAQW